MGRRVSFHGVIIPVGINHVIRGWPWVTIGIIAFMFGLATLAVVTLIARGREQTRAAEAQAPAPRPTAASPSRPPAPPRRPLEPPRPEPPADPAGGPRFLT
jgi:hypothetical protein